ncbi:MAG: HAD family hydrolase [Nitrosopumilaceae archaeon]
MFYHLVTSPDSTEAVTKILEKVKLTIMLTSRNSVIIVNVQNSKDKKELQKIIKKFSKQIIRSTPVKNYLNVDDVDLRESLRTNKCRFVFDVDSTLTQGDPGTLHPKIETILNKMNEKGIRIYFATGRSMPDLTQLIKNYPIEKYSIAENGGLILGFPPDNYLEFGNKREPVKVLEYLQTNYQINEDMKQGERFTEVLFLQKDVTINQITEAIKKTKARVSVHPSKNSYHISSHGINKGTAILEVGKRLHWGNVLVIAVGDADMDIPMFEKADYSFAVGNASEGAKKAAKKILNGKFEKGIEEIYELIKKVM